jgi:hypothetical protein
MGSVYSVHDERTGQTVALKRMRVSAGKRGMLALFEREYRTLAGIEHPRIIRVHEYGVDAGEPYYTMELVGGRDLYELAPLPFAQACRHLRDVATCLALLHTRRLLHRDVTPRNVRVTPEGDCKLLDFGALTSFGIPERTVGTPPCIPPEALRGAPLDQRADLFSFGALAYWTLTRRHAYPARTVEDLPHVWQKRPSPPSKYAPTIPRQADELILGLLNLDPLARPGSMAEVVERLNALAGLPPEDDATQRALAESYLVHVQFVGREVELGTLREGVVQLQEAHGNAALVEGPRGVGRTRLLSELVMQGELLGVPSLFVDAGMHQQPYGTAVALLHQLLDASQTARREAQVHAAMLAQLDRELAARLGAAAIAPRAEVSGDWRARIQEVLYGIVLAACNEGRLLIAIDNADEGDEASLAVLAALLRLTTEQPLALVCSARAENERESLSWRVLRERSRQVELAPLTRHATHMLAHSLFGDAPELGRFADWLHERSAGRPLHCMELVRRLHARGVVRYRDGLWALPPGPPDADVPAGLDELLAQRLAELSRPAYALAEAIAVLRGSPARARCVGLAAAEGERPFLLLDELIGAEVLHDTAEGYRFSHGVLRDVLLRRMSERRRRELHLRCAEHELEQARKSEQIGAQLEAGWHLLQAGEEARGADLLADAAYDTFGVRFAFADLQVAAPALEAALQVYTRAGRSLYERMPLLAALATAGHYEDRKWAERYGEEAIAAVADMAGLTLAAKLRRFLGNTPALLLGMLIAFVRFTVSRKGARHYRFVDVMVQLMSVVTTLTGVAICALDQPRAERMARTLAPFLNWPARLTPVGIAEFCGALKEIARENQAVALAAWTKLTARFENPRWYPTLPKNARPLYVGGLWFARGVFEAFRDGRGALEAADQLDRTGLKLYRMIGSELRMLHHAYRGELEEARRHREQVEQHAIQIGSASQVELWEPAAMILAYATIGDVIEMRRVAERLQLLAQTVPSLARYAEMAALAFEVASADRGNLAYGAIGLPGYERACDKARDMLARWAPRSFIGWGALAGFQGRALNMLGRHGEARVVCTNALSLLGPDDRPFVVLFLNLELELAVAEAGVGEFDAARLRLDGLLNYHARSDNPLTRGRLHEAYTRVAALGTDWKSYRHHLEQTRSWFRRTGTPALIGRLAALEALEPRISAPPRMTDPPAWSTNGTAHTTQSRSMERLRNLTMDETMDAATVVQGEQQSES